MSNTQPLPTKIALMKGGMGAGLMGGFALFSSFFAIDQMLDIPAGTFYKTIGITMGVDEGLEIAYGLYCTHGCCSIDWFHVLIGIKHLEILQIGNCAKGN